MKAPGARWHCLLSVLIFMHRVWVSKICGSLTMKFRSHLFWRIRGCIERPLLFNLLFVGTVFGAVDIRRSVVFEHENESARGSLRINHAATLEVIDQGIQFSSGKRLQNQRLVCAAFGGSFESSGDNIIWISISDDGGVNWSSPVVIGRKAVVVQILGLGVVN